MCKQYSTIRRRQQIGLATADNYSKTLLGYFAQREIPASAYVTVANGWCKGKARPQSLQDHLAYLKQHKVLSDDSIQTIWDCFSLSKLSQPCTLPCSFACHYLLLAPSHQQEALHVEIGRMLSCMASFSHSTASRIEDTEAHV